MSATAETVFTGACLCGDVRYEARGEPSAANHCHCTQCQRASGAGMVTWATWPLGAVRVRGKPGAFESSPGVHRSFCPRCGSTLFWRRLAQEPAEIDIAAGTLDEPDRLSPADHIFTNSRRRWLPLCDGLPAYRENRPKP
jgi:hypothetical protein